MPDKKISQLTKVTVSKAADLIPIVDLTEVNLSQRNKSIEKQDLFATPGPIGSATPSTGEFTSLTLPSGQAADEISNDTTLVGDSTSTLITEHAAKTYIDTQDSATLSAAQAYTDSKISGVDEHNELSGIQGGDTTSYYHISTQLYNQLSSSATAVLFSQNIDVSGHGAFGADASVDFGVGAPGIGILNTLYEQTSSYNSLYGIYARINNTKSDPAANTYCYYASVVNTVSTQFVNLRGFDANLSLSANGLIATEISGITTIATVSGDNSTITTILGGDFKLATGGGMSNTTYTSAIAGRFQVLSSGSGDLSITNAYGVLIKAPSFTSTGIVTNLYGLYIEDQNAGFSNYYNIYSAGASSENYFAGNVSINGLFTLASGVSVNEISNDTTLSSDSTTALITEHAAKTYADNQVSSITNGEESLSNGDTTCEVTFTTPQSDAFYSIAWSLINELDASPSIYSGVITNRTQNGFTILFSGIIDSDNFNLSWMISDLAALSSSSSSSSTSSSSVSSSSSSSETPP